MFDLQWLLESFKYAVRGLKHTLLFHQNLKVHLLAAIVVLTLGFFFDISQIEWVAIIAIIFFVLVTEMINTALEEVINLVKEEQSERARIAKDVSAGMVLMAVILALTVGAFIFIPYLF